mmetsp:Transcript_69686/g.160142  ORF Transcript_69686/g.160142 Transcript_69686/m.160142 type:complete len:190 (+) Transcript_69686:13-582(+)
MLVSEDGGGAGLPETLRPFADPQQRRERLVKQWTHCAANLSDPNHQLQMIPQQHVLTALKILSSSPIWFYDLRHILYLCDEDFRAACCFANLDERGYEVVDGGLPFVAALCKMRQVNSDEVPGGGEWRQTVGERSRTRTWKTAQEHRCGGSKPRRFGVNFMRKLGCSCGTSSGPRWWSIYLQLVATDKT